MAVLGSKGPRKFDYDLAVRMYADGKSYPQIAKHFGVANGTVIRAVKKSGGCSRSISEGRTCAAMGSKIISAYGYYRIKIDYRKTILEHRMIAEKALGRPLKRGETVHHINCNTLDNRPGNLIVCTLSYHNAIHALMRKHPYWSKFKRSTQTPGEYR